MMIALTGGIASGKSTIANKLTQLGAYVIDADLLAREAVAEGSVGLKKITTHFGNKILLKDGSLNRAMLAKEVFDNPAALDVLNTIVHPEVERLFREKAQKIKSENPSAVIVYDVPLLAERGKLKEWDHIIVASAPEELRIKRLVELRDFTLADAKARISNQAHESERLAIADTVIKTDGEISETIEQVETFWNSLNL